MSNDRPTRERANQKLDCSIEYHAADVSCTGSVLFVCQQGSLEVQACLLAATLREHLGNEFALVAAVPNSSRATSSISPLTASFLRDLDLQISTFANPLIDSSSNAAPPVRFLLANKIAAIRDLDYSGEKLIFLDSDQLCLADFTRDVSLMAPVTVRNVGWIGAKFTHGHLPSIYEAAGVDIPSERIMIRDPDDSSKALFVPLDANTSFISLDTNLARSVGTRWMELFKTLEETPGLIDVKSRHFQEQVTFTPSVRSLGLAVVFVPEPSQPFFHYHQPERILNNLAMSQCVARQLHRYPVLHQIAADIPEWKLVLERIQSGLLDGMATSQFFVY